jgi:MFS superfamily sulfate permease-like transporter
MARAARYLPILSWRPKYDRKWLSADAVAGLSVWALLVPQSLAYASLVGGRCSTGSIRRSLP